MNDTSSLLDDYRTRLRHASAELTPDVRDELLDDVEAHLAELRATSPSLEATRAALARLGSPEEVAAAAHRELAPDASGGSTASSAPTATSAETDRAAGQDAWTPPPVPSTRVRVLDVVVVVLLVIGGILLPGLGWVVGVLLLWSSVSWTTGEKLLGTLVVPGGLLAPLLLLILPGPVCSSAEVVDDQGRVVETVEEVCEGFGFAPWLGISLLIVSVVGPVVVGGLLLRRATDRSRAGVDAAGRPRP